MYNWYFDILLFLFYFLNYAESLSDTGEINEE